MELHEAIRRQDYDGVKRLLQKDNDLKQTNKNGNSCLHLFSTEKIARLLISSMKIKSIDITNSQNKDGDTPLHMWCRPCLKSFPDFQEVKNIMQALLYAGADCNIQNYKGLTVMHTIFLYGCGSGLRLEDEQITELLELLFANNADPNIVDDEGRIPLHYAVHEGSTRHANLLITKGSCVNARDCAGFTPLHYLMDSVNKDMMTLLLENGTDVCLPDVNGKTVLNSAAAKGNTTLVVLILEHVHAKEKRAKQVKVSSENLNQLFNMADKNGIDPLHVSAAYKRTDIVDILVKYGADVDAVDCYGDSCLHYAAYGGTIEIIEILRKAGADIHLTNNKGWTPSDFALRRNYYRTAAALDDEKSQKLVENDVALLQNFPADDIYDILVPNMATMANPFDLSHIADDIWYELTLKFKGSFQRYLEGMMRVEGIGMIPDISEVYAIQQAIEAFMDRLASCLSDLDKRFTCEIFKSGSWYEGTKIGDPVEFDYMFCLKEFQNVCSITFDKDTYDDVSVYRNNSESNGDYDMFFKANKLQGDVIMERFVDLCKKALSKMKYDSGSSNLYLLGVIEHTLRERILLRAGTTSCELRFLWTGENYKQLIITTDLVPAIHVASWPNFAYTDSHLLPSAIIDKGCHVVHKLGRWRLSFSLAEQAMMKELPDACRLAYIGAKVALHPAVAACFSIIEYKSKDSLDIEEENEDAMEIWIPESSLPGSPGQTDDDSLTDGDDVDDDSGFDGNTVEYIVDDTSHLYDENWIMKSNKVRLRKLKRSDSYSDFAHYYIRLQTSGIASNAHANKNEACIDPNSPRPATDSTFQHNTGRTFDSIELNTSDRSISLLGEKISCKEPFFARLESGEVVSWIKVEGSDEQLTEEFMSDFSESMKVNIIRSDEDDDFVNDGDIYYYDNKNGDNYDYDHDYDDETNDLTPIDARHLIPSYLLKLLLFDCIEDCRSNGKDTTEITTAQIFSKLFTCLKTRSPVPFYFVKKYNFLDKVIRNEDEEMRKLIIFVVSFLNYLFFSLNDHNKRMQYET